jgi:hypothetical protein
MKTGTWSGIGEFAGVTKKEFSASRQGLSATLFVNGRSRSQGASSQPFRGY